MASDYSIMVKTKDADALKVSEGKNTVIAHVVNDLGLWGAGFVVPLGEKYPLAKSKYLSLLKMIKGDLLLGQIQIVPIADKVTVCNMFAMRGVRSKSNPVPLDYGLLEKCLSTLRVWAEKNEIDIIQVPKIGAGLAGGNWNKVLELLWKTFATSKVQLKICLQQPRPVAT